MMFLRTKAKRGAKAPSKGLDFKTMISNVQQAREEQGGYKRITPDMLQKQAARLNKVDNVTVPGWDNVTLSRNRANGSHDTGAHYADFIQQTRRDLSQLAGTRTGQEISQRIGQSGHNVSIMDRGNDSRHGGSAIPSNVDNAKQTGVGSSVTVVHQPDRTKLASRQHRRGYVGSSSAMSLGHELIHGVHMVEGNLESGKHVTGAKNEERTTVGHHNGHGNLTENKLRSELQDTHYAGNSGILNPIPPRKYYGKNKLRF